MLVKLTDIAFIFIHLHSIPNKIIFYHVIIIKLI
jgi:hypothetical protein